MQITDVTAIPVEVDLRPLEEPGGIAPYDYGKGASWKTERTLIRLDTEGDVTGWGETFTLHSIEATKALIETDFAEAVIGRDVWEIQPFLDEYAVPGPDYAEMNSYLGGIEMAMYDAFGKHLGVSVSRLLGGRVRDRVDASYCLGMLDTERSREQVRHVIEQGYPTLKTKAGGYDVHDRTVEDDVERLVAMAEEADGRLEFRVDANQSWSVEDAVRVGARLEDAGVYVQYFEQPIRIESYGTYERLRQRLRTPIGVNEDLYFQHNLYQLIKRDAVDVGVIDLVPAGGFTGLKRLAAIAAEANVSLAHHNMFDLGVKTAALLHATATTPAIDLAADTVYEALADHVIESPFEITDGSFAVPEGPGLGVEVDRDAVERLRVDAS